ncbi:alcohol dehydrogenase [Mycetocola tolaasinivorans]|uniref:Alcohol dehydrogenase n=2 Tax=Mycetocola tolaasinivorans TaxID=76635 RepID=A0A3L7A8S0_9MICO|nr:alcohol dehydrogenase [Mycetocola tolaasinivorans]
MHALQLNAPRETALVRLPLPETSSDGLLLRTRCVSICATDVSYFEGHLRPETYPIVLGHEFLGEVVELGEAFRGDVQIGDRVVYWGQTDFAGFAEYRSLRPVFSGQDFEDSFLSDRHFYDDRRAAAVRVPDTLDDLVAPFIEPTTGALRSILTNPPAIGDRILILGSGPIGIIAGSILRAVFAPHSVESVDTNPVRDQGATEHFSDRAWTPDELAAEKPDNGYDYVFDTLPTIPTTIENDPRQLAMRKLRPRGRYILYGASQDKQLFDNWLILAKGLTIAAAPFCVSSFPMRHTAHVIRTAMRLLERGVVDGARLGTRVCAFSDIEELQHILNTYRETTDQKTVVDFREGAGERSHARRLLEYVPSTI